MMDNVEAMMSNSDGNPYEIGFEKVALAERVWIFPANALFLSDDYSMP